ncbi:MAG TPA: hypothetical protein DCS93_23560, partial [Microscillaceae bacterium]|nr:hypothetical protein [Microscillaceae bacterium]
MKKSTIIFLLALINTCLIIEKSKAQIAPIQNQYYFNSYIYNPAWLGKDNVQQVFLGIKKQWIGVEGSPTITTLTYEKALASRVSFGGRIININEGPIFNLSSQFTASYRIELGLESYLNFGMSLGVLFNGFNASKLDDPDDPLVAQQNSSNLNFDGGVGFGYQNGKLNIGLSLPNFANPQPFAQPTDKSRLSYSPWDYLIGSISYAFEPNLEWQFTPTLMYHYNKRFSNQWETALKATYQGSYYLGGILRKDAGFTLFGGLNIGD